MVVRVDMDVHGQDKAETAHEQQQDAQNPIKTPTYPDSALLNDEHFSPPYILSPCFQYFFRKFKHNFMSFVVSSLQHSVNADPARLFGRR